MEQRVLVIKIGRGKIISKPWDFEAMCLCDDNREGKLGTMTLSAVAYLFEGTKATEDFLAKLNKDTLANLCQKVKIWYYKDLLDAIGKNTNTNNGNNNVRLRYVYKRAFEAFGILPKDLGLCRPRDIFYILQEEEKEITIPRDLQALYGL